MQRERKYSESKVYGLSTRRLCTDDPQPVCNDHQPSSFLSQPRFLGRHSSHTSGLANGKVLQDEQPHCCLSGSDGMASAAAVFCDITAKLDRDLSVKRCAPIEPRSTNRICLPSAAVVCCPADARDESERKENQLKSQSAKFHAPVLPQTPPTPNSSCTNSKNAQQPWQMCVCQCLQIFARFLPASRTAPFQPLHSLA